MLPDNPFLQLTIPRATRTLSRLHALIWKEVAAVPCSFAGSRPVPVVWESARKLAYKPVDFPFRWGQLFDQGWFKLRVPRVEEKGTIYLHWDDQGEGTAYVDGVPYYGFDVAHRYCALPRNATEIYIEGLCLQSAIWHPKATGLDPKGSRLNKAALFTRNGLAWEAWHDLRVLFELALEEAKANHPTSQPKTVGYGYLQSVDVVSPLYRRLLRALDDGVNAFDKGGLLAVCKSLKQSYKKFKGQADRIRAVVTGNAHIDLVWLWPERTGEYKATHTFSTMNRLMDLYRNSYSATASPLAMTPSIESAHGSWVRSKSGSQAENGRRSARPRLNPILSWPAEKRWHVVFYWGRKASNVFRENRPVSCGFQTFSVTAAAFPRSCNKRASIIFLPRS
jgi:alpha-mannosidase